MTVGDVIVTQASEAVRSLDWDDLYNAARKRLLKDATGGCYDEHLAREIADRLATCLAATPVQNRGEDEERAAAEACLAAEVQKLGSFMVVMPAEIEREMSRAMDMLHGATIAAMIAFRNMEARNG